MNRLLISTGRILRACVLVGAAIFSAACSTESKPESVNSSQTHWLRVCTENSDCGELSCVCGVCTEVCSSNATCSGFSPDAQCSSADANGACGEGTPRKVCLASCSDAEECSQGATCAAGVCAPAGPGEFDAGQSSPTPDASRSLPIPDASRSRPTGVVCSEYPECGKPTQEDPSGIDCAGGGDCTFFEECEEAICIAPGEACELTCPELGPGQNCSWLDSNPGQLGGCAGTARIGATKGPPRAKPSAEDASVPGKDSGASPKPADRDASTFNCDAHATCGPAQGACSVGAECFALDLCPSAICIPTDDACKLLCPEQGASCAVNKSYPLQIACLSVEVPEAGACLLSDETGCGNGSACCDGLVCCEGLPYPADGRCAAECTLKSDRNIKHNLQPIDPARVLEQVSSLPIASWSYDEEPGVRHLGPMAQDFKSTFQLGASERTISPVDAIGVALSAIQALNLRVEALERENALLREAALKAAAR